VLFTHLGTGLAPWLDKQTTSQHVPLADLWAGL